MAAKKESGGRKRGVIVPKGKGVWMVRVYLQTDMVDGKPKHKYASKTIHGTYKQADQLRVSMLADLDVGEFITPSKQTVQAYVDNWLTTSASLSVSVRTLRAYRYMMERYVFPTLGTRKLVELSQADIQLLIFGMKEKGLGRRMMQYTHTVLKSALKQAVLGHALRSNPASHIKLPPKPAKRTKRRILMPEHIHTIIADPKPTDLSAYWIVMLNSGMRPGECAAITWSDLKGDRLSINKALVETDPGRYEVGPCKNEHSIRTITLPQCALTALAAHKVRQAAYILKKGKDYTRNDLIFANRVGEPLCLHNVYRAWKSMLKRLDLPHVALYNCRHTHISLLLANGTPVKATSERVGHSSPKMTLDIYQDVLPETEAATASVFDAILLKAASA